MANEKARFTINGSAAIDATTGDQGYTATKGETLSCTLSTPAGVLSARYEVFDSTDDESPFASFNAPALTWNENSLASITVDPSDTVTIDMPSDGSLHSYIIRCTVSVPAQSAADAVQIFERLVAIEDSDGLRKTVPAESSQYRARGWSDDLNLLLEKLDPRNTILFDHFVMGSFETGEIGTSNFAAISGGGTLSCWTTQGHPGQLRLLSGTTGSDYVGACHAPTAGNFVLDSGPPITFECLVSLDADALNGTHTERIVMGFGEPFTAGAGVELDSGVYIDFEPGASANWRLTTAESASRTTVTSSVAAAVNTWTKLAIKVLYDSGDPYAELWVNDALAISTAVPAADFPTSVLGVGFRIDSAGGGNDGTMYCDYVKVTQVTYKTGAF